MSTATTNGETDGITWTTPCHRSYPYVSQHVRLPTFIDPYQRNIASLLASIAALCLKIKKSIWWEYTLDEIKQIGRICNNEMTTQDYEKYFHLLFDDTSHPGCTVLHLNLLESHVTSTNSSIQDLTNSERVILSSYSSTGKVILFHIIPSKSSVDAYCTTIIPYHEIKGTLEQLLKLLSTVFGKTFSVKLRLQVPQSFHADPLFTALFFVATIFQRGRYYNATETSILKYKLWVIRDFIPEHDKFLGKLERHKDTKYSYPFLKPHREQDSYTLLEQKGWDVMDVEGDGNCGYYSFLLGLRNVGIMDYHIDTQEVSQRIGIPQWRRLVIALREHLKEGSEKLFSEVFPAGSPNRTLDWWFGELGVVSEEDAMELSDSFLIPDTDSMDPYFSKSFTEEKDMHKYHMHPYWAPLVVSYLFGVRVVVITRTTKPTDNARKPEDFVYTYTTKVFDFSKKDYEENKNTYVPITSYEKCVRLSDLSFLTKPTIELLYLTGWKFSHIDPKKGKAVHQPDDNHFLFLRRVLCLKIPPNLPLPGQTLRKLIFGEQQEPETTKPPQQPSVPTTPVEKGVLADAQVTQTTTEQQEPETTQQPQQPSVTTTPVAESVLADAQVTQTTTEELVLQSLDVNESSADGPSIQPPHKKRKRSKKKVPKKAKTPKVTKKAMSQKVTLNDDKDDENQSISSNIDLPENILYDADSQCFFTARFESSIKRYLDKTMIEDLSTIDEKFLDDARSSPNTWVSLPLGDCSYDEPPPMHLTTKVKCLYEQLDRPYCVTYCMASALFYCGFVEEAQRLAAQASLLAPLPRMTQIDTIKGCFPNLVPSIGGHEMLGKRCQGNNKKKRRFTWSDLFSNITPYPTLVVPVTRDGNMTHAFCVVDDLIFDSSVPHALKLTMASVDWIFQYKPVDIFMALRFHQKVSPEGRKVRWTYRREVKKNWVVASESLSIYNGHAQSSGNKAYDVECNSAPTTFFTKF
jgi:hypothetical protein